MAMFLKNMKSSKLCKEIFLCKLRVLNYSQLGPKSLLIEGIKKGELVLDQNQLEVANTMENLCQDLKEYVPDKNEPLKGLYLYGEKGNGKSMLLNMFYKSCTVNKKSYMMFEDFINIVHGSVYGIREKQAEERLRKGTTEVYDPLQPVAKALTIKAWLYCIDEFSIKDAVDAAILQPLFKYLFENKVVFVFVSSRAPADLHKDGLKKFDFAPVIKLIKENCKIIRINCKTDFSKIKLNEQPYYFIKSEYPLTDPVDMVFSILIKEEGDKIHSRTFNILDRKVKFNKTCGGVLDTNFQELCDRDIGSIDYMHLAKNFHTVIIRDVPLINMKMREQARRFTMLIDTLYNNNVKLVLSAEDGVSKLFPEYYLGIIDDENAKAYMGSDERYAFKRTISRIKEMVSRDYWEKSSR